nr:ANTAR domain-containing protein [bacterium]
MESILVASSTDKGLDLLEELLHAAGKPRVVPARSGAQARRMLGSEDYALILINAPLQDEFGHELATFATETTDAGVMLLCPQDVADRVADKVETDGVFVVQKPLYRPLFYQALRLVYASRSRIVGLKKENIKLQTKIEEMRLVDRAKCALIQTLGLTEKQAHRYIEKQAMDMRVGRKEIAQNILRTYEV